MKRTLSIILAIMMILSTVSFAAPSMAGVVTGVEEASEAVIEDAASLFEEEQEEPILLKEYTFDESMGENVRIEEIGNYPGGIDGNGSLYVTANGTDPRISISLGLPTANVTSFEFKVKYTGTTSESEVFQMFYNCNGAGPSEANKAQIAYNGLDQWQVFTFDASTFSSAYVGKLTSLRLDPGSKKGATYYIDYIKIYGYPTTGRNFTPGINQLTGDEELLDFDDMPNITGSDGVLKNEKGKNFINYENTVKTLSIVDSPVAGETGKALMFSGYDYANKGQQKKDADGNLTHVEHYPGLLFSIYEAPEDGRPVFIKFDGFIQKLYDETETAYSMPNTGSVYPLFNGNGNGNKRIGVFDYNAAPTWTRCALKDDKSGTIGLAKLQFCSHIYAAGFEKAVEDNVDIMHHYIDNLGFYPYYKVTYKNGDEELGTAWVLDDGNGNILESFDPEAQGIAFPEGKNGWALEANGDKVSSVALENEDIVLYAVNQKNFKPGYNLLTDSTEPMTFDKAPYTGSKINGVNFYDDNGKKLFDLSYAKTMSIEEVNGSKALKLSELSYYGANGSVEITSYPGLRFVGLKVPEEARPVFAKMNVMIADADSCVTTVNSNSFGARYSPNGKTNINGTDDQKCSGYFAVNRYLTTDTNRAYTTLGYGDKSFVGKINPSTSHGLFALNIKVPVTSTNGYAGNSNWTINDESTAPVVYFDDISYIPYYKVTYMNGDEELGAAWVLDDGNGNLLDSFNPLAQGVELPDGKNAWSLSQNGEEVTSVELNNEDIVLYAVYVDKVPESNDELLFALEFNGTTDEAKAIDMSGVTYYDVKNDKGSIVDGSLVLDVKGVNSANKKYDIQVCTAKGVLNIPAKDVKRFEIRLKIENATEMGGKTITGIGDDKFQLFYNFGTQGYSASRQYDAKYYRDLTPDEEGYYTISADMSSFSNWESESILTALRADLSATNGTHYVDYIRIYGQKAEFSPAINAPQKRESFGLRVDDPETTGVRFKAAMANEVRDDAKLTEYGWIVALADTLGINGELTHQFKANNGKTSYVTGKNYCKAENLDKIYETEENYKIFTAVVTGIPTEYANRYLVVRPYSVIGGAYVYGESMITCPRDVGQKLYDKWVADGSPAGDTSYDYVKYQEYIDALGIKK